MGKQKLKWVHDHKGYWCASRSMPDGVCDYVYTICPSKDGKGYIARASNTAYGAQRIAININDDKTQSFVFKDIYKLMRQIEDGSQLWLYNSHCNCIGKITMEEY